MPNEGWKKFIELAGGPDALIVVFPTAMDDPVPDEIGEVKALNRFGAKNIKVLQYARPQGRGYRGLRRAIA